MSVPLFITAVVFGLMLAESRLSSRNETILRESGAIRPPGDPWLAIAVLYPAAFLLMGVEGAWRATAGTASSGGPAWPAAGVLLFTASKMLKYWAIGTLGTRWSFRVWVLPGRDLVRSGPYQYVAHPNYIAIAGELVGAAMMMRAAISGPVMIALFGVALAARIRFENRMLEAVAAGGAFEASEGKR